MGQAICVVDAFTDTPFAGNPAAVCVLSAPTTEAWMRGVAAEMNLSETAFLVPRPDGDHDLRWLTPSSEVDLCGHATLASAHVLGGTRRFHTASGVLTCTPGEDGAIVMDFPAIRVAPVADPPDWAPALGLGPGSILAVWDNADGWVLAEAAAAADVRAIVPDRAGIMARGGHIVVAAAPGDRDGVDSVCRVFGPAVGIDEDPVTGAAHCLIGPWLAERTGRSELMGEQASARGGRVGMRVEGERVALSGRAVTVWEGALHPAPPAA
jgi:predicted PhzF superfamily epimerase YddE/YHI9